MRFKDTALGRLKYGQMNRTEAKYADKLAFDPEVVWFKFEGIRFRLADNTNWTPDFAVMKKDRTLEIHEVKGFMRDASNVRMKVAAEMFPFIFKIARLKAGQWTVDTVGNKE